jgi:CRP/FNR family transcriptional regulator, cyclic AMP receptor protein
MAHLWFLEQEDLYSLLCPHKMAAYAATHAFVRFGKDDVIYLERDDARRLYLIAEGCVKIVQYSPDGTERVKAILGKGEVFGEMALFGAEERNECAIALREQTLLCPITVETMQNLMRDYQSFSLRIYKLIGWKIRKIERRLELLLFKDSHTRLVEFLKDLALERGVEQESVVVIHHFYTQQNIADLLGMSRPTLNLLFNEFREAGALDFKRGVIILNDVEMFAA